MYFLLTALVWVVVALVAVFVAALVLAVAAMLLLAIPLVVVVLLQAVGLLRRVPFSYNLRNLLVRWPSTLLTALAFVLVVGLMTVMLAFVNGLYKLTQGSGQPGNVMVHIKFRANSRGNPDKNREVSDPWVPVETTSRPTERQGAEPGRAYLPSL